MSLRGWLRGENRKGAWGKVPHLPLNTKEASPNVKILFIYQKNEWKFTNAIFPENATIGVHFMNATSRINGQAPAEDIPPEVTPKGPS